ncbi:MAG: discoidin domain-containing protein [Clostridiaceae bacterium]|nr:discoidin domain-containing protein [Clostridiaceae bacterium]
MKFKFSRTISMLLIQLLLVVQFFAFLPAVIVSADQNLALGKSITASSHTQIYYAHNANDGNINTYWEAAPNSYPNTLTVDLGSTHSVSSVVIKLNPSWFKVSDILSSGQHQWI